MKELIFACHLGTGESEREALKLARTIRTFGGEFCFNPIWMLSTRTEQELSQAAREELFSLGARLVWFEEDASMGEVPFSSYVSAASIAESLAQGQTSLLVWLAENTLVFQPPARFLLPPGKSLGACPVHLQLLGSDFASQPDDFWHLIYHACHVEQEHIFAMQTLVDAKTVRAYFNAGLLVVRPERGLLRSWQKHFHQLAVLPEFEGFFQRDELYGLFMHQAVLAGTILASLRQNEIEFFPQDYNYPLHLHHAVEHALQPETLGTLVTCRYEEFHDLFGDQAVLPPMDVEDHLQRWFDLQRVS